MIAAEDKANRIPRSPLRKGVRMRGNSKAWPCVVACVFALVALATSVQGAMAADVESAQTRGCSAVAEISRSGSNVLFKGGRSGCTDSQYVTMSGRRDVSGWFDQELAKANWKTTSSTRTLFTVGTSGHRYFTEVTVSDGAHIQSNRLTFQ